ncbi:hypothetical protein BOTBODRAFT_170728 [Botryobasidium botryosum FD-172 SS1]|uniref:Uncharacterized protein n=1 Tax=Botryobasidium botryosum (strain FD-172 SS1) TaxID=930990 RepID=A0A067MVN2_BOTB1|nr:hypothetical protein BOTBODRAFT_170728 [Botryobasidium botryosum FD-172 SS1]
MCLHNRNNWDIFRAKLEGTIRTMSALPRLQYLKLTIPIRIDVPQLERRGAFIKAASDSIPTLRAAALVWNERTDWQRVIGADESGSHFRVVSKEIGEELEEYYDWA